MVQSNDLNIINNNNNKEKQIVIVVDPFSSGAVVAQKIIQRGIDCICVCHDTLEKMGHIISMIPKGMVLNFAAKIFYEGNIEKTVQEIKYEAERIGAKIVAIMPGAETGVRLADRLCDILKLKGNKMAHSAARRDKYLMGETLREVGIHAAAQKKATCWEEVEDFIKELNPIPFKIVLKPLESAGTDDVTLCYSMEHAKKVFQSILGKINGVGLKNTAVLLQEYLEGTEYVVDTVSRDKKHKVVAVWEYDKRCVNDAAFVYFGVSISRITKVVQEIIQYHMTVLDALGIENGPAHGELKYCKNRPVLVEVGARCHGGEATWVPIVNRCIGYNQADLAIDSLLDGGQFNTIPDQPGDLLEYGCEAMFVSYKDGILKSIPGLNEIEKFSSFLSKEIFVVPGDKVYKTVDMFTTPGSVMLVHKNLNLIQSHMERIRELEKSDLFELE